MSEPMINGVSVKEHLSALVASENQRVNERFALVMEQVRVEFNRIDRAVRVQTDEYDRRLRLLNEEFDRARDTIGTYLPRDHFDGYTKEQEKKADAVKVVLDETRERLDAAVRDLAASVEKTRLETTARIEAQISEVRDRQLQETNTYVREIPYTARHEELQGRIGELASRLSTIEGGNVYKTGTIGWLFAGLGLVITVVVIVVNVLTSGAP